MNPLIPFNGNPLPEPHKVGFSRTRDGFDLRYAVFRATIGPCKGSVIVLHGRNECIEKYAETTTDLLARGFDVCTFDWRGQGRSTRFYADAKRGYVDGFDQYATDLDHLYGEVFLPDARPPFFILAHSMGALAALYAAPLFTNRVNRMVFSAPFLGLPERGAPASLLTAATNVMCFAGLGRSYMGAGPIGIAGTDFDHNRLTSDSDRFARNKVIQDPANGLGLGAPTAAWLRAALAAIARVHNADHMARLTIPAVLVSAGADTVVSSAATEAYTRRIKNCSLITIAGAKHELLQEQDRYRDQFLAAFDAFIPGSTA